MKNFTKTTRFFTIMIVLFLCLSLSPEQSRALAFPAREMRSGPNLEVIKRSVVIPIGPVSELPGSTIVRVTGSDTSTIGKAGGLAYTLSGIELDKYTSVYWGPQDLTAIRHSLQGALVSTRIMTLNEYLSNLPGGIGYWIGWSPSIYYTGDTGTRFKLESLDPLVLASSVNIGTTDVVLPVDSDSFSVNLLFLTDTNGAQVFSPSNDYFDTYYAKTYAISGIILSSFTDAFWYTAPDVEVASQSYLSSYCLGTYASIQVTTSNHG
ncbi:MAG: hypothetical protein MUO40_05990, partial [Anaerolineaceae bacterium]|nr:hypothetical protein [Anaerolineaceae bacterium]